MIFKIKKKIYLCNEVYGSETIKINSMILWVFNEYKLRKAEINWFYFSILSLKPMHEHTFWDIQIKVRQ